MNYEFIEALAGQYQNAMQAEFDTAETLAAMTSQREHIRTTIVANAYETGNIDGKNAEIRKAQELSLLTDSKTYLDADAAVKQAEFDNGQCAVNRKALDVRISLIKAWLYSQTGVVK